jgi:hypothetical protein
VVLTAQPVYVHATAEKQPPTNGHRFVQRYLDPASRLGEILFGLIMVLSFTLAAGFAVPQDKAGVRELLLAAIGCNLAWGVIDAVMYLMNCMTERVGKTRLIRAVQSTADPERALALIQEKIRPELEELIDHAETEKLSRSILAHISRVSPVKQTLTRDDIYGAIACFWLVFVSCLPAGLPFLIFSQPRFALRVSNVLLLALLFLVGQKWAKYAGTNRLLTGSVMVAIGLALVGVAILLGG